MRWPFALALSRELSSAKIDQTRKLQKLKNVKSYNRQKNSVLEPRARFTLYPQNRVLRTIYKKQKLSQKLDKIGQRKSKYLCISLKISKINEKRQKLSKKATRQTSTRKTINHTRKTNHARGKTQNFRFERVSPRRWSYAPHPPKTSKTGGVCSPSIFFIF